MRTTPRIHNLTATATGQRIVQDNPDRVGLMIYNNEAANTTYLTSNKEDPITKGIPIKPDRNYENLHYCQGEYFVICATGETADLRIEEDIKEV